MSGPREHITAVPSQGELRHPGVDQALATAGMLIHWVTSRPELVTAFRTWIEHCPDGLTDADVTAALEGTHATLEPGCPGIPTCPVCGRAVRDAQVVNGAFYCHTAERSCYHDASRS